MLKPAMPRVWPAFACAALALQPITSAAVPGAPVQPADTPARTDDARAAYFAWRLTALQTLAGIAVRIAGAAGSECAAHAEKAAMIAGLVVDQAGQYQREDLARVGLDPADARARFLVVDPQSAAGRAGLRPGDRLALPVAPSPDAAGPSFAGVNAAIAALRLARARVDAEGRWHVTVARDGALRDIAIAAEPTCGTWVDLRQSERMGASSNRNWIQLSEPLMRALEPDHDAVAFVMAHEMAHQLAHLAGSADPLCTTTCEMAADRKAVDLMVAAGFDPAGAVRALALLAHQGGLGMVLDGRHGALKARLAAISQRLALPAAACLPHCTANGTTPP